MERVQRRCTKFILNDYQSNYKLRLVTINLLPLSLWLELMDITFLLSCLKCPQEHFNIYEYISFISTSTRSSSHSKLKCLLPQSTNSHLCFIYFIRVTKLWNALPVMDLDLSLPTLKYHLYRYFWQHFLDTFDSDLPCTWHIICPCNSCYSLPSPHNYSTLHTPGC